MTSPVWHLVKSDPPFLSNYVFVHFCKIRAPQTLAKPSSPFFNLRPGIYPTSPYISIHQQRLTSLGNQVRYVQTRHVDSKHKYNFLINTNTISFSTQIPFPFQDKYNYLNTNTTSKKRKLSRRFSPPAAVKMKIEIKFKMPRQDFFLQKFPNYQIILKQTLKYVNILCKLETLCQT